MICQDHTFPWDKRSFVLFPTICIYLCFTVSMIRVGNIPTLSQHIDFVEYATPLSNEYWVNAVRGGNYGPDQTPDQMGPGRFADFTAGIDGLFLAGAGTIGGGVMACIESGIQAALKAAIYLKD